MLRFELLQTPREDGEVLIEPAAAQWPALIERTVRGRLQTGGGLRLAGTPLEEVRHSTRVRLFGPERVEPVVACGHQPAFAHPGVWAKHVVVHEVVSWLVLHGADLVVDNDVPHSTVLNLPELDPDGFLIRRAVGVLAGPAGSTYESKPPLSPTTVDLLHRRAREALASVYNKVGLAPAEESQIFQYFRGLLSVDRPSDIVEQHLAGRARIDRTLSADLHEIRVSAAFDGPFVADILLNLERFAREYNASLAAYRRDQRVRGPDRPLPDLKKTTERMEAPFWIYRPLQPRHRLWVESRGEEMSFFADRQPAGTLSRADLVRNAAAALASLAPWVLRPRALTLTLWARLLACDFFVHGIGGAKYDRINDGLFHRYYGCEPPPYGCVSATLRLPLPRFEASPADRQSARRRMRDLRFNPQRYVNNVPEDWLGRREELIARSRQLRETHGDRLERRRVFQAIRDLNARLSESQPGLAADLEAQALRIARQLDSNAVADSREFFYALQPPGRLEMLASRLRRAIRAVPVQA